MSFNELVNKAIYTELQRERKEIKCIKKFSNALNRKMLAFGMIIQCD